MKPMDNTQEEIQRLENEIKRLSVLVSENSPTMLRLLRELIEKDAPLGEKKFWPPRWQKVAEIVDDLSDVEPK